MRRVLVDTNVFIYAMGVDHPLREPCREIIAAAGRGELHLTISAEVLQEYAHVRLRRGVSRESVAAEAAHIADLCDVVPVSEATMRSCFATLTEHEHLQMRDRVMCETAVAADVTDVVTADAGFDAVASITRIDPSVLAAELTP